MMLTFLQLVFYGFIGLISLYLLTITIASWYHVPIKGEADPQRMGILIPAHNEAAQIANTLISIQACSYPKSLMKIIVLADNCSDQTAALAKAHGAEVYQRHDEEKNGKGQALDWFFRTQHLAYDQLDSICLVDADIQMHPEFLNEMNRAMAHSDVEVVQGFNGVANPYDNWRTALVNAAFNVFNHLRMAGSHQLFGHCTLKGNGMGFKTNVLKTHGWSAFGTVEDLEFSLVLAEHHIKVHYQPTAIITSEMAVSSRQANIQRRRWEGGRFLLSYQMMGKAILKGQWALAMDLLTPPLSLFVMMTMIGSLTSLGLGNQLIWGYVITWFILIFYVASGQLQRKAPLKLWVYLACIPLFLGWKGLLYLSWCFSGCSQKWLRTPRKNET